MSRFSRIYERVAIPKRERQRNAWGLRQIRHLMADPTATDADWDALRAEMDRMRAADSVPEEA